MTTEKEINYQHKKFVFVASLILLGSDIQILKDVYHSIRIHDALMIAILVSFCTLMLGVYVFAVYKKNLQATKYAIISTFIGSNALLFYCIIATGINSRDATAFYIFMVGSNVFLIFYSFYIKYSGPMKEFMFPTIR